jgi:hypothetical protein
LVNPLRVCDRQLGLVSAEGDRQESRSRHPSRRGISTAGGTSPRFVCCVFPRHPFCLRRTELGERLDDRKTSDFLSVRGCNKHYSR